MLYIKDIIHKVTTKLVKEYDIIFMEDINIKDLLDKQDLKSKRKKMLSSCLGKIKDYLDYINLMSYNMVSNGGYHHSALYKSTSYFDSQNQVGRTMNTCTVEESMDIYKSYGVDADGNIDPSTPVSWDYEKITKCEIIAIDDEKKNVSLSIRALLDEAQAEAEAMPEEYAEEAAPVEE